MCVCLYLQQRKVYYAIYISKTSLKIICRRCNRDHAEHTNINSCQEQKNALSKLFLISCASHATACRTEHPGCDGLLGRHLLTRRHHLKGPSHSCGAG